MLSKAQIKYIRSLTQQKYRKLHKVFVAEGDKIAKEWLRSESEIEIIAVTESWADTHGDLIRNHLEAKLIIISENELSAISTLHTANEVLLVVNIPEENSALPNEEWTIALDGIQDPGNMGTIIRIADWFGIQQIILSRDCADVYNSKVVQSAMGGHLRINFYEIDLEEYLLKVKIPVLAASLNGRNIYEMDPYEKAVLIIGNESKGIGSQLLEIASIQVNIPRFGGAESLNAAVSAGILCSHLLPH